MPGNSYIALLLIEQNKLAGDRSEVATWPGLAFRPDPDAELPARSSRMSDWLAD